MKKPGNLLFHITTPSEGVNHVLDGIISNEKKTGIFATRVKRVRKSHLVRSHENPRKLTITQNNLIREC